MRDFPYFTRYSPGCMLEHFRCSLGPSVRSVQLKNLPLCKTDFHLILSLSMVLIFYPGRTFLVLLLLSNTSALNMCNIANVSLVMYLCEHVFPLLRFQKDDFV